MQNKCVLIRGIRHLRKEHAVCAAAIGNFDGIHLGHQALIKKLVQGAQARQLPPLIILFEPQPEEFFLKDQAPARLMRLREKIKAISLLGVQRILILPFNESFSNVSAENFIENLLLEKLQVRYLVAGDDFRFGKQRQGTLQLIQDYGIQVEISPTLYVGGQRVSSTALRKVLSEGRLDRAEKFLGRFFSMSGCVRRGDQRGRLIGFPTANIALHRKKVPLLGVYAVRIKGITSASLLGVANVGMRPTVGGLRVLLEVHIFDFNEVIYGQYIEVEFIHKLREEKRYDTFDELKAQIFQDAQQARQFFSV